MLLFIHSATTQAIKNVTFQYISCYCLSCIEHKYNKMSDNFNTSHVTVYRRTPYIIVVTVIISIHLMLLFIVFIFSNCEPVGVFQYISCYCLSYTTSLSELYSGISIHLMLLFILFETFFSSIPLKFQYISCYCLSSCRWFCS